MSLRRRAYLSELISEPSPERMYSHRGFITDWKYPINGVEAGSLLRDGKAKLVKANGGRVFLSTEGGKEYKVKAALAKGIRKEFWK